MGKSSKGCEGLRYMKGSSETQAIVWTGAQAKPSSFKNVVWTNLVLTHLKTGQSSSNKRRPRGIRYYYNRNMGHIWRHYRSGQKKRLKENNLRVKKKWVKKKRQKALWCSPH